MQPLSRSPVTGVPVLVEVDPPTHPMPEMGVGGLLGAQLRAARLAQGLTQAELARRTGINRPNIARLESAHIPTLFSVLRIAWALEMQPSELLGCLDQAFEEARDE